MTDTEPTSADQLEELKRAHRRDRTLRSISLFLLWLLVGSLGGVVLFVLLTVLDRRPPGQIRQMFDANTITYRDGRLQFYCSVDRTRQCSSDVARWLWTKVKYNGQDVELRMPLDSTPMDPARTGPQTYLLSLPLPDGIWDGQWYYRATSVSTCGVFGWLHPVWSSTGDVPVTIKGTREKPMDGGKRAVRPHIVVQGGGTALPHSAEVLP